LTRVEARGGEGRRGKARGGEGRAKGADEVHVLGLEVAEQAIEFLEQLRGAAAEQRLKSVDELCECTCRRLDVEVCDEAIEGALNIMTDLIGDGRREHAGDRDDRLVAAAVDKQ
jgi:hypothetical protein